MSRTSQPHVCFIGCGRATTTHARLLSPGVARCSFASRDREKAERFRTRFRGERAFGSYAEAIAHCAADLIVVATPPALHGRWVAESVREGIPVAVEKPAFPTSAEAADMSELARSCGVPVYVLENYAYKPVLTLLRRIVAERWIGDLRFVRIDALKRQRAQGWRTSSELMGRGPLLEGGVHWLPFLTRLGPRVETARVHPAGPDGRSALVAVTYAGGGVGTLHHSWDVPGLLGPLRRSRLDGTHGGVTFESNGTLTFVRGRRTRVYGPARDLMGFRAMWADVLASLRSGRPPRFTLDDAGADLRVIEKPAPLNGADHAPRWATEGTGSPRSPLRGCGIQG